MSQEQVQHREMVEEIDNCGKGLNSDEIKFIGDLIDDEVHHFTAGQMSRIRGIHRRRVLKTAENDDDEL